jgi:hypothetical protein
LIPSRRRPVDPEGDEQDVEREPAEVLHADLRARAGLVGGDEALLLVLVLLVVIVRLPWLARLRLREIGRDAHELVDEGDRVRQAGLLRHVELRQRSGADDGPRVEDETAVVEPDAQQVLEEAGEVSQSGLSMATSGPASSVW